MPLFRLACGLLCCAAAISSCATRVEPKPDSPAFKQCAPPAPSLFSQEPAGEPPEQIRSEDGREYSPHALEAADLINSRPLLARLSQLRATGQTDTIEYLVVRQRLTERILLSMMEVSGTVAEIICERDRADQIAHRMDEIDNGRVKGLTLASILAGGVAAIVSGGIGLAGGATTASDAVEVTGES